MQGHVRKAKDRRGNLLKDTWDIVVELPRDPETPKKRNQKWKRVKGSKKQAEEFLSDWLHDIRHKGLIDEHLLFITHAQNWLVGKENSVALSTYEDYANIIKNHLIPEFKRFKVGEVEPEHISAYYKKKLEEGLSETTVKKHHRVLKSIFKPLAIRGKIKYNPADLVSPPISEEEFEPKILTRDQIIETLAKAKVFFAYLYIVILLAFATGMRRSEIAGLMWDCVDLTSGKVFVRRQYKRTRKGLAFAKLKTKGSKRVFTLPIFVIGELLKVKEEQEKNKKMLGDEYKDHNLVCCWPDGRPLNPRWLSEHFTKFSKALGLGIRLHDARHSHVTLLTELRISDKEILDRVGQVTQRMKNHYTHITDAMNDHVANALNESVFAAVTEEVDHLREQQKNQDPVSQTCLNMFERDDKS